MNIKICGLELSTGKLILNGISIFERFIFSFSENMPRAIKFQLFQ